MKITATVSSKAGHLETHVQTNDASKTLSIAPKPKGLGSSVNGGELLLLAIATCFCNDLYREAAKRNIALHQVDVLATAEFGAEGEPGFNFNYRAQAKADATQEEIQALIAHTDKVAEIHNTLRRGVSISMS